MKPVDTAEILLAWTVHPARRRPLQAVLALSYLVAAVGALHLGFRSAALTTLGALILLAAVADYLLPTAYRLTTAGAEREGALGRRRLAWHDVRAAAVGEGGVLLSPVTERGLARAYRGLFLPAAPEGQPDTAELVRQVDRLATARVIPEEGPHA